jgi:hypothetical protein
MTKPRDIQAARAAKSAQLEAEAKAAAPALTVVDDAEINEAFAPLEAGQEPEPGLTPEELDIQEAQKMGAVQVSVEEMFQIIGAQEYELRALRGRVGMMAQQIVTLKGVIRNLELKKT